MLAANPVDLGSAVVATSGSAPLGSRCEGMAGLRGRCNAHEDSMSSRCATEWRLERLNSSRRSAIRVCATEIPVGTNGKKEGGLGCCLPGKVHVRSDKLDHQTIKF